MIRNEDVTMMVGCTKTDHCIDTRQMPASGKLFVEAPRQGQLEGIIENELEAMMEDSELVEFEMTQLIPAGLEYVTDSAAPVPVVEDVEGQTQLHWTWSEAEATGAHTVTYQVEPLAEGVHNLGGQLSFLDASDLSRSLPLPQQPITVSGLCEPQVTPETPTDVPPPPTATLTPEPEPPTNTPVPPPTVGPQPVFLPVLLREHCVPEERLGDITLVIDMSSSMDRLTSDGVPKKQAVVDAAKAFVSALDFTPNVVDQHDQVAVVCFNESAWIQQPLTHDQAAIDGALVACGQRMASGTRLDLAFQKGAESLATGLRKADNTPVIILLTDGVPSQVPPDPQTGQPEDTVVAAAQAAKDQGVTVYTIGFGRTDEAADPADRVNAELLGQCASDPSMAYVDPSAERLTQIYREIADVFTCPTGRHDWTKPWP